MPAYIKLIRGKLRMAIKNHKIFLFIVYLSI
jgi:hypothetical protein